MGRADQRNLYSDLRLRTFISAGPCHSKPRATRSSPKTEAGKRTVALPPHVLPVLRDHMRRHVAVGSSSLLFPAERDPSVPLPASTLRGHYEKAATAAGLPDLHFHGLRHTGATLAAVAGGTLAELKCSAISGGTFMVTTGRSSASMVNLPPFRPSMWHSVITPR